MDLNKVKEQYPEVQVGRAENLAGQCFGKWLVLYRTENSNSNKTRWVCQCSCEKGTIKPVETKTLKSKTSTNCGCERLKTISEKSDKLIHKRNEQGEIILKRCSRCKEWLSLNEFWKNKTCKDGYCNECKNCQNTAKENRYNLYKKNAKSRNLIFEIKKEEFYNLTQQPCVYCGSLENYNGLDRLNSSIGYTIENVVPCCSICNKMKLDYSKEFFLEHIKKIIKYQEDSNE